MWGTTAVVFVSDLKASFQIAPAVKRVVFSDYSALARDGGSGGDGRQAVGGLWDEGTLERFVPVLGATGSVAAHGDADASKWPRRWPFRKHKVKSGDYVFIPDESPCQGLRFGRPEGRERSFA